MTDHAAPAAPTPPDPLADGVASLAWLIVSNKPVYPLYVWYFAGHGVTASLWTMASLPLYLAIALRARTFPLAARLAFPAVALADTLFSTKLFGPDSGTELFFGPAALIAALSFRPSEARVARTVCAILYAVFVLCHGRLGAPWHIWTPEDLSHLREVNIFAVASLTAFVIFRFAPLLRS